jgi:TolB protein
MNKGISSDGAAPARWLLFIAALAGFTGEITAAHAAREPVLKQVDLPHSYYWRELYLPQLTTGPSSADFMPDSETLVYSMAGSLWRQKLGEDVATELTHAQGAYDYQPDVAADGGSVVFTRYDGNAMELWRLDLASGKEQRLTSEGAVNVEPRISPDGKRLAWVSTQGTGHFNLFVADLEASGLRNATMLLGERQSTIDRYYYSKFDHAINPSWSPDGQSILYVGNPEVAWGSGDIMLVDVADPSRRRKVHSEETSWSARPEFAPDGRRILFSSYHGRQTHQLWLTTIDGAAPLPLTFGDDEKRNARWSPDGRRIAFIGHDMVGNTALHVVDAIGGATRWVFAENLRHLTPHHGYQLRIVDAAGGTASARVRATASDGRTVAPRYEWIQADDGFDRSRQSLETAYFQCTVVCHLEAPTGGLDVVVQHGFDPLWRGHIDQGGGNVTEARIVLEEWRLPREFGDFRSADLHLHMNYGGHYRRTPGSLLVHTWSEGVDHVFNLVVNKEERIPDIAFAPPAAKMPPASGLQHAQEHHTSFWGHLGLLGLDDHFVAPDFSAYRHTAMASPYPHNGAIADLAHAQGALVGYVHPFDTVPDPAKESITNALPADVAHGKVDYLEVVGFSDHKATAAVWYRLLNLGFRLPAGAGTDAMTNYASLRGPIGMNRVFLDTGGAKEVGPMLAALKHGRGFATNGPLLGLLVDGNKPGQTTHAASSMNRFKVALRSIVPVDHLELVVNGEVVHAFELGADRTTFDGEGTVSLPPGGWVLLRAWNDGAHPDILDIYPYATTNPVWVEGEVVPDAADAQYFADWLDRTIAAADARTDWNDAGEERETLEYLRAARAKYAAMGAK